MSESHINTAVRGSYFLADYELRITARCLEEDFRVSPDTPIGDLLDRPIVKALIKDRATDPDAGKTIGPEAGEDTIRRLGYWARPPRRDLVGSEREGRLGSAPTTASIAQGQPTIPSRSTSRS